MLDFIEKSHTNQQLTKELQSTYLRLVRTGPGVLGFKATQGKFYEKHFKDDDQALALIAAHA